ncbi:cystatin-B-like [Colossoma macropomum]|uniref:cystatin-B-like n=1 Tax=Colossoma macropomum TaxID=42526 RepID=UPI001863B6B5|nr:cystatin-B-like [Colossoma macropomum]
MSSEKVEPWSEELPATQEVQDMCDKVRDQIPGSFKLFKAFSYRVFLLARIGRYEAKVYVGDDKGVRLVLTSPLIAGYSGVTVDSIQPFRILYEIPENTQTPKQSD